MQILKPLTVATVLGSLTACAVAPTLEEREASYVALSEQHFTDTLNIVDDPLNPSIEIDTRAGHRDYVFSWELQNDQFLRAFVARESGSVSLQAYVRTQIPGVFLRGTSVTFAHTMETRAVDRIGFDANCSGGRCINSEDVVFSITVDELSAAVEEAERRAERTLVFRIQGQSGRDRDGRFHIEEARAMLSALERF
ncbi:MAG: hypothetical protein AAGI44_10505 [Pseudomonadota bacterium]